uniref:Uncharacterized protein n=1 Tax=Strigamia maritima TaxID=126957 RepID=T1IQ90_STRMM
MEIPFPEKFVFSDVSTWPQWRKRFMRYRDVANLDEKTDAKQVSGLLYCMGDKAEEDTLICDRIAMGIRNRQLCEKMQMIENLTLTKAIDMARQSEQVRRQQADLKPHPEITVTPKIEVDRV